VVVGILFLQQSTLFAKGLEIEMVVDNAQGIGKGAGVHVRGVKAGTVTGIEVRQEGVVITMRIREVTEIPADSRFMIGTQGLLGGKAVQIEPGSSDEYLTDGARIDGSAESGISGIAEELGSDIGGLEGKISRLLDNMNALLGEKTRSELHALLQESQEASQEVGKAFETNSRELEKSLDELQSTLAEIRSIARDSGAPLKATLEQLESGTEDLDSAIARLYNVGTRLDLLLQEIDRGEGTVGRVMTDEELHRRLNRTLGEMEALVKDIKENPDKYMTIKVF
jgi:phospholipid/cholesterol/gamma-HCH transport system substrate-binding protein